MEILPQISPLALAKSEAKPATALGDQELSSAVREFPLARNSAAIDQSQLTSSTSEPPPAIVVTRSQPVSTSLVYEPVPVVERTRLLKSENEEADAILTQALNRYDNREEWGNAAGIMERLISSGVDKYQNRAERSLGAANQELGELSLDNRTTSDYNTQATMDLVITTKDGDTVRFSLQLENGHASQKTGESYVYQEVAVSFRVEGDLSDEEKAALEEFAKNIQGFSNDFFASGGESPRLENLGLFESGQLASIDVRLNGADADLKLVAEDTDSNRRIDLTWRSAISAWEEGDKVGNSTNKLQLLIDKHGTSEGRNIQQDLALTKQLAIIDEQLEEGRASDLQSNYIKDAFSAIHQDLFYLPADGIHGASNNMVTGLADYQLTFSGEYVMPMQARDILENPVSKTAEKLAGNEVSRLAEGFKSLELSQNTQILSSNSTTEILQRQSMSMEASFFSALDHLESPDFSHQNFKYHAVNNSYQIDSRQLVDDNQLISASISQSIDRSHQVSEYNEGELVGSINRGGQSSQTIDTTAVLKEANELKVERQNLEILDQLFAINDW